MTLEELLAELAKVTDRGGLIKALQENGATQPIYQDIFNKGHATATATAKTERKELEKKLETATGELETANTALKDLRDKTPDVATVTANFQKEITELKAKHKAEMGELKEKQRTTQHERLVSDLKAKLAARLDGDFADVRAEKNKARIRITDTGYDVLQPGKDIPYAPADGKEALDLLVEEIVKDAPAKFVLADGDRGSGTNQGAGAGGGAGSGFFGDLRKGLEAERKAQADKAGSRTTAAERMGIVRQA